MDKKNIKNVNETHLNYLQNTIARMGQNSFHVKSLCVTVVSALLGFHFSQPEETCDTNIIVVAISAATLFSFLDTYYLYLERGFCRLYSLVAKTDKTTAKPIKDYDMTIPKSERGFGRFCKALLSPSTGPFYLTIILLLLFVLWSSPLGKITRTIT